MRKWFRTIMVSLIFVLSFWSFPNQVWAVAFDIPLDIAQINFTTASQTLGVNASSSVMTVQTQDGDGNEMKVSEKTILQFNTDSGTGQFANANASVCNFTTWSSSPFTLNMNNGTANKNFCYKDATAGVYILTVTAEGKIWTPASQNITIEALPEVVTEIVTSSEIAEESSVEIISSPSPAPTSSSRSGGRRHSIDGGEVLGVSTANPDISDISIEERELQKKILVLMAELLILLRNYHSYFL